MSNHKAWLVDLDGTLYHALPVKAAMCAELLTASSRVRKIIRAFRHQHEALRLNGSPEMSSPFEVQLEAAAWELGLSDSAVRSVIDEWMFRRPCKWLSLFPRASLLREIVQFRATGGQTALVSDYPARQKLEALNATNLFDVIIASGEFDGPSQLKPDPNGFLKAASKLGVAAHQCLVLGDRPDADGLAAASAGMSFRLIPGRIAKTAEVATSANVSAVPS